MSIATTTDVGIAGGLKQYYQRVREDVFPLITPMWAQFTKMKKGGPRNMQWGGEGAVFNVVNGDPVGQTFSAQGFLPRSNFRRSAKATVGISRGYVRQQFDMLTVTATRNNQAAFISLGQQIDEEVRLKSQLMIQEAAHGDPRGVKAIVSNVVNQSTIDIVSPYGIVNGGQGALWVAVGGLYAFRSSNGAVLRAGGPQVCATIALQVAPDTYRITFPANFTGVVAGDVIVGATANDDAFGAYPNGLTNILNRGAAFNNLHGIDPSVAGGERWNTTRMVAGTDTARADQMTESDFHEIAMRIKARSGEDPFTSPDEFCIITTPGIAKSYAESMIGQRTVSLGEMKKLNGGYSAQGQWNGVPIIGDNYCPVGTVYFIHKPTLGWLDAEDFGQITYEDSDAWRFVSDRDAYETSFKIYYNILTTKRNAHAIVTGFAESFRYSPLAF
jgi:hypothetical protein